MRMIRITAAAIVGVASGGPQSLAASCTIPNEPVLTHDPAPVPSAQLVVLDKTRYPLALCNDGTPATYLIRSSGGAAAQRWVIFLQGGGQCSDQPTCTARRINDVKGKLASLTGDGQEIAHPQLTLGTGILSSSETANPDFYDATAVRVNYCSSDLWIGAHSATGAFNPSDVATWDFQGRAIVQAVIADLKTRGLASAQEILFAGGSAGSEGAAINANDVWSEFPSSARKLLLGDAGYSIDVPGYDPTSSLPYHLSTTLPTPGELLLGDGQEIWGGRGDAKCEAIFGGSIGAECANVSLVSDLGFLPEGNMFLEAQQDLAQLGDDGIPGGKPKTAAEQSYAAFWGDALKGLLAVSPPATSYFSPNKNIHTELDSLFDTQFEFGSVKASPQQAVGEWYRHPCTPIRDVQR